MGQAGKEGWYCRKTLKGTLFEVWRRIGLAGTVLRQRPHYYPTFSAKTPTKYHLCSRLNSRDWRGGLGKNWERSKNEIGERMGKVCGKEMG